MNGVAAASWMNSHIISSSGHRSQSGSGDGINPSCQPMLPQQPMSLMLTAALLLTENTESHASEESSTAEDKGASAWSYQRQESFLSMHEETGGNGSEVKEEHVYLLSRPWLHNWIKWAAEQPVPPHEVEQMKKALKLACEVHELRLPPSCGGEECFKRGVRELPRVRESPIAKHTRMGSFGSNVNPTSPGDGRSKSTGRSRSGTFLPKDTPSYNWKFTNPGPLDASLLSVLGYPLLLRPHVLVGRGEDNDEDATLHQHKANLLQNAEQLLGRKLRIDPDGSHTPTEINYDSKMGCCAVPSRFYDLLRSIHGVKCDDGISVTFQPYFHENPYILHHHVISSYKFHSAHHHQSSRCTSPTKYHDIHYPSSQSDVGNTPKMKGMPMSSSSTPPSNSSLNSRKVHLAPLEFKRRLLMNKSRKSVEVYPLKFIYSIVDDGIDGPPASLAGTTLSDVNHTAALLNAAATHLQNGVKPLRTISLPPRSDKAQKTTLLRRPGPPRKTTSSHPTTAFAPRGFVLVSRATPAKQALTELLRLAVPDKSSSCVRLWSKIGLTAPFATQQGDGFEVVDLDDIPDDMTSYDWSKIHSGSAENLKSMDLLIEVKSTPKAKWRRASFELGNRIQVGDYVDASDSAGKWYESIVRHVEDYYIKVHYLGWSSKWDAIIHRRKVTHENDGPLMPGPPRPLWSRTNRWREGISVGIEVEVREAHSLVTRPKWFRAFVREVGGEDDSPREIVGGAPLEELENVVEDQEGDKCKKKKPLLLLHRTRQVLVEVPQERFNTSNRPSLSPKNLSSPLVNSIKSPPSKTTFLAPQPPFLRWVNLYGEEICELFTHNKPHQTEDPTPATITYAHDPNRPPVEVLRSWNNIHGSGFIRESLRGVPPAPGSVGLHNLGNSCFLNSILQCLNHIEPLTQFFLSGNYKPDLNTNNPLGSGGRVAMAYAALLHDMWGGEYSTLAPRLLKQTVANFAPQFNNIYQHDSQEFCSFLMDGLHEDLNRVQNKPYVEDLEGKGMADEDVAIESWRKHLLRHHSVIVDYCQGMHRSHLTCPECGNESVKFDVFSTISLPIPNPKSDALSLGDCLKEFTTAEQLDKQNAWYCSECKKHVCARKLITLWSTPDILILHLKRFKYDKCSRRGLVRNKVEDTVSFPVDNLDMSPYIMGPVYHEAPAIYKLFGVSEHTGCTANSGHYTATVRNSRDGKWYKYNDSHVGFTSGDASITGGAYLLFYQRAKGRARWAGMEKFIYEKGLHPHGSLEEEEAFTEVKSKKKKKKPVK